MDLGLGAGAASLLLAASGPGGFGISASPPHIYAKQGHSYQITITDTGRKPLTVHTALSPAYRSGHGCDVQLGRAIPWASIKPATLHLQPRASAKATVTIRGRPPAGKAEAVASFVASTRHAGVSAQGGVGVAVYTSEPGHAVAATCHHAVSTRRSQPSAGSALPAAPQRPWWPLLLAAIAGASATALVAATRAAFRRRKRIA